jgi:hypothetical protein
MIRAIRPNAAAQDDATMLSGWNLAPNIAYTLTLVPGAVSCAVLLYDEDGDTLIASGAALAGTEQPCVLRPQTGQTVSMVDEALGWHLLVTTTGTESQRTVRIGPMVDLPDEIHPIFGGDDDMALARATAAIDEGAHYRDDVTVTCPLGLGAGLGDTVSVPVDSDAVTGQVESITWTATPDGASDLTVIRRHVAIAPEAFVEPTPPTPPTLAADTASTDATTEASGNVLDNDDPALTVVAVNGLSSGVGSAVAGSAGGLFTVNSDGSWTFDPDGDFDEIEEDTDTAVTYYASDGEAEASTTLTVTVSPVSSPLWTPDDITTALWLDADDPASITLNGSTVSQWADKSGNDRHLAQSTPSCQPSMGTQNGRDTVSFDGTDDVLGSASRVLGDIYTIAWVAKNRVQSQTSWALGQGSAGGTGRMYATLEYSDKLFIHQVDNGAQVVSGTPAGGHKLYALTRSGASSAIKIDGGPAINGSVDTDTVQNTSFTVGGALGNYGAIDVCEVVVFLSVVSAGDIQRLEGYLAHKWGLADSLPAGHPYKSAAPTATGDPHWPNASLLIQPAEDAADGSTDIADTSPGGHTVTVYGDAQTDTSLGLQALQFDGVGDRLSVAHAAEMLPGSEDFTVEAMVMFGNTGSLNFPLIKASSTGHNPYSFIRTDANKIRAQFSSNVPAQYTLTGTTTIVSGQWYHICLERSGSAMTLYLDGAAEASTTFSGTLFGDINPVWIGAVSNGIYPFTGHIQFVRLTVGVARYGGAFTPPTYPLPTI